MTTEVQCQPVVDIDDASHRHNSGCMILYHSVTQSLFARRQLPSHWTVHRRLSSGSDARFSKLNFGVSHLLIRTRNSIYLINL